MNNPSRILDLLSVIHVELANSTQAYQRYLKEGKTYAHAKELKRINSLIREELTNNRSMLTDEMEADVNALLFHYEEWTAAWDKLDQSKSFDDDEEFVFENPHRFPREAADRLEQYYVSMSEAQGLS